MTMAYREKIIESECKHEHAQLVSKIAKRIAQEISNDPDKAEVIGEAAILHDIGKNFVPASILKKPGAMTDEEFAIIKTHTQKGFDCLIDEIRILLYAAIMSLQHHEHVDGNGYDGVTYIHETAKLVAVADVFDALISPRSYKKPWALDDVTAYIKDRSGKQFDAIYVDAMLDALDDIQELYQYHDQPVI